MTLSTTRESVQTGPPVPRLVPGQLQKDHVEILKLLHSDDRKNVYQARRPDGLVTLLEGHEQPGKPLSIPESVEDRFPECLDCYQTNNRSYLLFRNQGEAVYQTEIPCVEAEVVEKLLQIMTTLGAVAQEMTLDHLQLEDLVWVDGRVQVLTFPRGKQDQDPDPKAIRALCRSFLFRCLVPKTTRNLEHPLRCFSFSAELEDILENYFAENINFETVVNYLTARVEEPKPLWQVSGLTDVGRERSQNEDACGWLASFRESVGASHQCLLLAVADGMGGHQKGELASHLALNGWLSRATQFVSTLRDPTNPQLIEQVCNGFDETARSMMESEEMGLPQGFPIHMRPGSTLVAGLLWDRLLVLGNCGDSRAYCFNGDRLARLTVDHSLVQLYLDRGQITSDEAKNHMQANVITSFMGIELKAFKRDLFVYHIPRGASLLFCSDGLTDMLSESEIVTLLKSGGSPQETCRLLVNQANEKGGRDNISVIVAKDWSTESDQGEPSS